VFDTGCSVLKFSQNLELDLVSVLSKEWAKELARDVATKGASETARPRGKKC
jgi:hypothetical protein